MVDINRIDKEPCGISQLESLQVKVAGVFHCESVIESAKSLVRVLQFDQLVELCDAGADLTAPAVCSYSQPLTTLAHLCYAPR